MAWWRRLFVIVLSVPLVLAACDDWTTWDAMFKRSSVGSSARGWTGGDGAISAALPNNRVFWIFGDSLLTSYSSDRRPQLANPLDHNHGVFGNTIAIQEDKNDPDPARIRSYARTWPGWTSQHTGIPVALASQEITQGIPLNNGPYAAFFNHALMGLTPPSVDENIVLWPAGAECLDCGNATNARLIVALTQVRVCDPGEPDEQPCSDICGVIGQPPGCGAGVNVDGTVVARFKNIAQAPSSWQLDTTTSTPRAVFLSGPAQWGKAFLDEPDGFVYMYGYATGGLVVARVLKAQVMNPAGWTYLNTSNAWTTSPSSLKIVAAGTSSSVLSVDKVTLNGLSQYVLMYGDLGHMTVIRTSSNKLSWTVPNEFTPRLDRARIDSSIWAQQNDLIARNKCPLTLNPAGVVNLSGCGVSYHGTGHAHLSSPDGTSLITSYIVPWGPNPFFDPSQPESDANPRTGGQDARFYRPKFALLDTSKLAPWCAGTTDCWRGIVKQYPQRLVNSGFTDGYDITKAPRFYAAVTRITGSANLKVEFRSNRGATLLQSVTCAGDSPTCNLAKPTGATQARAIVSGPSNSMFVLRVHYAGDF